MTDFNPAYYIVEGTEVVTTNTDGVMYAEARFGPWGIRYQTELSGKYIDGHPERVRVTGPLIENENHSVDDVDSEITDILQEHGWDYIERGEYDT